MAEQTRSDGRSHVDSRLVSASALLLLQMYGDLHDLCQPLTALQFQLESSKMLGSAEASFQAIDGSLLETRRLFEVIDRMRSHLRSHELAEK